MGERSVRKFTDIGSGVESTVFGYKKVFSDGREQKGKTVIKNFEFFFDGIDETLLTELKTVFATAKKIYGGDLFPQQRFMVDKEHLGKYVLVQKKVEMADPSDIFDYTEENLPDEAKKRLELLVDSLKQSYRRAKDPVHPARELDENIPLDLRGKNNLVVTVDGKLQYVDTGAVMTSYKEMFDEVFEESIASRIAALECVLGRDPNQFLSDDFYHDLMAYCAERKTSKSKWYEEMRQKDKAKEIFFNLRKLIFEEREVEK